MMKGTAERTVLVSSQESDHNRALYLNGLPGFRVQGLPSCLPIRFAEKLLEALKRVDVFHLTWAEYLFEPMGFQGPDYFPRLDEFLGRLRELPLRIAWTQHNRRPHYWPEGAGRELYRRWAASTDVALHHSVWGREILQAEYNYPPACRHPVVLLPDLAPLMPECGEQAALERSFNLPPAPLRFGVLGRYQKEKQVELILQAFAKAGRSDQQLIVTAYTQGMEVPKDPRIFLIPRGAQMSREEIGGHLALCDGLVAAQTGDGYLTSGLLMDALAGPTPMFVPGWKFYEEMLGPAAIYHGNDLESLVAAFEGIDSRRLAEVKAEMGPLRPLHATGRLSRQLANEFLQAVVGAPNLETG